MIKFILILVLGVGASFPAFGEVGKRIRNQVLFKNRLTTGNSEHVNIPHAGVKTFQATGLVSATTGAATILIQGSNVDSSVDADWVLLCTITLTLGTDSVGDGCATNADWRYQRARVSAISGTDAAVNVYVSGGVE